MISFDFITDENFRKNLQNDFQEMEDCYKAKSWKAVHVLSGSIIEAVLIDYLIGEEKVSRDNGLKMDFGEALNMCMNNKIISEKANNLSSVVKTYRNLIHPGRMIRVEEKVNQSTAEIARAVVSIIVDEIEIKKQNAYGLTAEQIVSKLERDSLAVGIIAHLLTRANSREIERLLTSVLPERYMEVLNGEFTQQHVIPVFNICYREAINLATNEIKIKAVLYLVRAFKEESDQVVSAYATAFLRASDLSLVSQKDRVLVKDYLLNRLKNDQSSDIIIALDGIAKILETNDIMKFVDPLIIASIRGDGGARNLLQNEACKVKEDLNKLIFRRLNEWINHFKKKEMIHEAEIISAIKNEIDIPF